MVISYKPEERPCRGFRFCQDGPLFMWVQLKIGNCPKKDTGHKSLLRNALSILLLALLAGCGTMNRMSCEGDGRLAVQEWLYFGTETPSGHVTPEAWALFLSDIVTPRFPEGFSAWQTSGQWRSASGEVIREPSYILSLVHSDSPSQNRVIQELTTSYKTRFQQEAVLRVKSYACTSL